MQLFGTEGQKFHHCPGTKGHRDKLKILQRDGTGRDSQNRDRTQDKTGQSRKGHSKTGKGRSKTGKDDLKQENDVLEQIIYYILKFLRFILSRDVQD